MNLSNQALWDRLAALEIDDPAAARPFSLRLAQEQGWTLRFAQRVVEEYKRFLYLTQTAKHVVCPSEEVDAVWHQHLCYSKSYWIGLCEQTLGRPLHHEPSRGGSNQLEYHRTIYCETLASYLHEFGETAPADIWPPVDKRFAPDGGTRHVSKRDYWLIPKPKLSRFVPIGRLKQSLPLFGVTLVPMFGAAWNPLDMAGPDFLKLYLLLLAVSVPLCVLLRWLLRGQSEALDEPQLHPLEVATLAGGEQQAMHAALAELVHTGHVDISTEDGTTLYAAKNLTEQVHPLSKAIYQGIHETPDATPSTAWNAGLPHAARISARLEKEGLLLSDAASFVARWLPVLPVIGVLLLGVAKIAVGWDRGKPVAFLLMLCVATFVLLLFLARKPWRTRAGDRWLKNKRSQHLQPLTSSQLGETNHDLLMQWCLYGLPAMMVTGGAVTALQQWINPRTSAGSGAGGTWFGTGCGGGGCGGGGGGGCGGGCGGCGGCGGD